MSKDRIFARTGLGNDLLENPKGKLSGDEMLLVALIDGHTGYTGVVSKIPPSVRVNLDSIFARLLSAGVIEEVSGAKITGAMPNGQLPGDMSAANKRYADLEKELAGARAQLEAMGVRQKEVEVGFHKLRLRISAYTETTHAKLAKKLNELAGQIDAGNDLRASFEDVLNDAIESLNPLNQAIADQQQVLDQTLRLRFSRGQLDKLQKEREAEEAKMAQSHPYYKKLRGLEFFKGFTNAGLLQFLEIAKLQVANTEETVFDEGDVGMPFFIIVSGSVSVFKGESRLATLNQGDFFGEFAYLSGDDPYRSARVVADSACEFLMVDPLDIEFAPVQLRLNVVEALLRGQVRRALISSKPLGRLVNGGLSNELDYTSP